MAENKITVYIDGKTEQCGKTARYLDLAAAHQAEYQWPIVLVRADGRLRELSKRVRDGSTVEFVTVRDKAGCSTYRRSLVLLMLKAIRHTAEDGAVDCVSVHFSLSGGYYCTVSGRQTLTQEFLDQVKACMQDLVHEAAPIQKETIATWEARKRFREYGMYDKEELFRYRRASKVNIYNLKNFEDYFYGYMLPDTSYLKYFDLRLYEDGFVLLFPELQTPDRLPEFCPEEKLYRVQKESLNWSSRLGIPTVGALNSYIVSHPVKELIMIQEACHEKKIASLAARIAEEPDRRVVLIAGPSSSGKTTFSHRLATQLSVCGLKPHPIAADNYFLNRENTPLDEDGKPDFERLEAIDVEQLNEDMQRLLAGETVELPFFNFKTGKREYRGNRVTLGPRDILIIEGIHCLNDRLTCHLDAHRKFKIYISALTQLNIDEHNRVPTTDGRLLRRIVRDARTRGSDARRTIDMWPSVRRGEENNIFPFQEEADAMFNSTLIYELAVLKLYAEPLLFSIRPGEKEYDEAKRLLKFLDYFLPIPADDIPNNSLLREFIGGGCFDL